MLRSQVDLKKNQDLNYIYFSKGTEIYGTARISLDVSLSFCHQSFPLQHKGRNDWLAEERQRSSKEILPGQVLYSLQRWPGLVSSFSLWPALTSAQIISNRWSLVIRKWSPDQPRNYSQSQEKWMMKGKSFAFDISLSFHSQFLLGRLVSRVLTTYGPHMAVGKMKRRANHLKFPLKRLGSSSFIILLTAMASGQERNHCSFRETSDGWIPAKLLSHPSSL